MRWVRDSFKREFTFSGQKIQNLIDNKTKKNEKKII